MLGSLSSQWGGGLNIFHFGGTLLFAKSTLCWKGLGKPRGSIFQINTDGKPQCEIELCN